VSSDTYRTTSVPVRGGLLAVAEWGPSDPAAPVVLAVHGITASHMAWSLFATHLPHVRVIAPDLRGRGRSRTLPAPYGMRQHAEDLTALLDHLGVARATVVGHSMGAFVSVVFAAAHPDRVDGLLLVDGGIPIDLPAGMDIDTMIATALGPAAARLSTLFASKEAYREFWKAHPSFADRWSPSIEAYVDYDLVDAAGASGAPGMLKPATAIEAMTEDSRDLYGGAGIPEALEKLPPHTTLLTAPRGLMNGAPLYSTTLVERWRAKLPGLAVTEISDVNHYTIIMAEPGAGRVAAEALRVRTG
jgi:pimeloyl-ACP methyl ester carboxylesterase